MNEVHQDQPATIPAAALAFAGTIGPAIGYFANLAPEGTVIVSALIMGAAGLAVAIYLNKTTTSVNAPVLPSGTVASIEGSADKVVVQPTPPGPVGVEATGEPVQDPDAPTGIG